MPAEPLLSVQGLARQFRARRQVVRAVDGVSFHLDRGEILGLIGESGCGKTTTGRLVVKLLSPTAGAIRFEGADITGFSRAETASYRRRAQMIFQDPYASMNPRFRIRDVMAEPLLIHGIGRSRSEREEMMRAALAEVKLEPAGDYLDRFPHMLSGGQRQRVATARTLILSPALLVADEPVSMIDLSTRAEILSLMKQVQRARRLSYLYITHDISTARFFTDRLAVMYLGRIVEIGTPDDIVDRPAHPYTRALISAVCEPSPGRVATIRKLPIHGEIPSAAAIPSGCRFHPRCIFATEECRRAPEPELADVGPGHRAACRRWKEI
ncbi:MAG: ABC transporter ATP-binding protein [Spirochaetia bacterium]